MANAPRKTVSLAAMLFRVNHYNRQHTLSSADFRRGQNRLLADMLHATGNYAGFGFLSAKNVPRGEKPGVRYDEKGSPLFDDCDDSRVVFYASRTLEEEYRALCAEHEAEEKARAA